MLSSAVALKRFLQRLREACQHLSPTCLLQRPNSNLKAVHISFRSASPACDGR